MLFDPKWEQETRADPFTLRGLIAWLEKKPAETQYCWLRTDRCLVAHYLRDVTGERCPGGKWIFSTVLGDGWPYYEIAALAPHTYGAALKRARAQL